MYPRITLKRIPVELKHIEKTEKDHGIICVPREESNLSNLIATIPGPEDSPYASGKFQVSIAIGEQYPFRPPTFKFITPVFHPNIDSSGQICLDLLKMPPTGTYNPAMTLGSILLSIQLLLGDPNPDDPLQGDAADLFKGNIELFNKKAREHTEKFAKVKEESPTVSEEEVPRKKKKLG